MNKLCRCILFSLLLFSFIPPFPLGAWNGEGAIVYNPTVNISSGSWNIVSFTTEIEDDNNYFDFGTPNQFTIPAAGWYLIWAHVRSNVPISSSYATFVSIVRNGTLSSIDLENYNFNATHYVSITYLYRFASGNAVDLRIYQNSTGIIQYKCWMSIMRIGDPVPPPPPHAATHENGGSDEINVGGLSGVLADYQHAGWLRDIAISSSSPSTGQLLRYSGSQWAPSSSLPAHATTHENGGSDEINVGGLSGLLADPQDAGWLQDLAISTTDPTDGQVLVWNDSGSQWEPDDLEEASLPDFITATLSGTLPVVITNTYHYTEELSSGHDIAIIRSFTYGEMAIALALFSLLALFGLKWLFELIK